LWIPSGTFLVNTRLTINKLTIRGAGPWYSIVQATVPHGVGFFGNAPPNPSVNVALYDFSIFGDTNVRDDNAIDSGIGGALTNGLVQNLWIEHVKCGIWVDGPFSGLHVVGVTIRDTYADGVNLHDGVSNTVIEQSLFRNTGDDALAMWSDTNPDTGNVFKFNTIQIPALANGVGIYGGANNSATDNYVADTICEGGGYQASNRFNAVPLSGTTIFARNTAMRCGAPNHDSTDHNGAFWFWPQQSPLSGTVNVTDSEIIDSSFSGISFWGTAITDLHFSNLTITTATYALEVRDVTGQAYFTDVVASKLSSGGIYSCDTNFNVVQVSGDDGWSDVHCN